jgi:hypothetical protein
MNWFKISPGILVTAGPPTPQNLLYTIYFDRMLLEVLVGSPKELNTLVKGSSGSPAGSSVWGTWESGNPGPSLIIAILAGWFFLLPTHGEVMWLPLQSKGCVCWFWLTQQPLPSTKGRSSLLLEQNGCWHRTTDSQYQCWTGGQGRAGGEAQ